MEHMTKIQFCVYVLITFLSLFLVVTNGDTPRYTPRSSGMSLFTPFSY